MPNYRIEPYHTRIYQTDTLGFYIKAKDIDDLRRKLIQRDSDAEIFPVLTTNTHRCIGILLKKKQNYIWEYIWETGDKSYTLSATGKIIKRR